MVDDPREAQLLALVRREGPLSRQDLHQRMKLRPNTVGALAEGLIRSGLLREGEPQVAGPGRPRVPLAIDPERRHVVGVALEPGRVSGRRLNLHGQRSGDAISRKVRGAGVVEAAASILTSLKSRETLAVGVSATGFVDEQSHELLVSSTTGHSRSTSLEPLYAAAHGRPLLVQNDLQALAVQWMLTHEAEAGDDILLVFVGDGAVGASVLVNGRPIKGCVMGGNELGHTRMPVETERCFCGHTGCLERIVSTEFLQRHSAEKRTLVEAAADYTGGERPTEEIIGYLAMAIGNAINLLRPRRVVLASEFNRHRAFTDRLLGEVRDAILGTLLDRVRLELWDRPEVDFAEAAGWLALASIYRREWVVTG